MVLALTSSKVTFLEKKKRKTDSRECSVSNVKFSYAYQTCD